MSTPTGSFASKVARNLAKDPSSQEPNNSNGNEVMPTAADSSNSSDESVTVMADHGPRKTLQLGKNQACAKCKVQRRRCDARRPSCSLCLQLKRSCVYPEVDRSRTQQLLNKVGALEEKLAKLQLTHSTVNILRAKDKKDHATQKSTITPDAASRKTPAVPPLDVAGIDWTGDWWTNQTPPPLIQRHLIDTCLTTSSPHNAFQLHVKRFWEALSSSSSPRPRPPPFPGLLSAMYLTGSSYSACPCAPAVQDYYLARARKQLSESLGDPSICLVQWLQASCLLADWLLGLSRFLEARQELAGAIQLIKSCELHRIRSSQLQPKSDIPTVTTPLLPPPKDNIELGERIRLFWMVYQLDHMCSLVCGLPPDRTLKSDTETVWPRDFSEYEQRVWSTPDASVPSLFGPNPAHPFDPPCSLDALRCKALALLVCANGLSMVSHDLEPAAFLARFKEYHKALDVFLKGLPSIYYEPFTTSELDAVSAPTNLKVLNVSLMLTYRITMVAYIQLYGSVVDLETCPHRRELYDRRLAMAVRMMTFFRICSDHGIACRNFSKFGMYTWFPVARVFAQHYRKLQVEKGAGGELTAMQVELDLILNRVTEVYQLQLDRIRAYIAGQEDVLDTHVKH